MFWRGPGSGAGRSGPHTHANTISSYIPGASRLSAAQRARGSTDSTPSPPPAVSPSFLRVGATSPRLRALSTSPHTHANAISSYIPGTSWLLAAQRPRGSTDASPSSPAVSPPFLRMGATSPFWPGPWARVLSPAFALRCRPSPQPSTFTLGCRSSPRDRLFPSGRSSPRPPPSGVGPLPRSLTSNFA